MNSILERIANEKIVAIIRSQSSEKLAETVGSLYKGGIRTVEITMNTPGALKSIEDMKALYPDLIIGAGTVLDSEAAVLAINAGASFLLAPTLSSKAIEASNRYDVPLIPGVFTPTEALTAYEYGAKMVKIFPIRNLGPGFLKDLKGPLPFVQTMAVGGISLDNAKSYLEAGASSLGIGSSLVDDKLVQTGNFEEIQRRASQFVEVARQV
ncbi:MULTISPECIES: bifunctional 4-hydroxy-2-oxoglutarate aldolase/2-dehydro-3-deoxy-phosphogluconate aldolase [Sporosarcina]|uniref:2-dehydro-3-deoxyphosphogluconate aldolase / (4S)-4-hydroxy-2-oxoglutarate aldolase n=1 Tax=Sporosarcina newyorkensis TaxID=759851 RepID=A0A1T4Y1P4_9BACL|nr:MULTISPECIES: bifunctional 4-hydroxy-2-oxoglutarate aldolase/2-dehydro-3-deoxy-phosphogluconate aldolase [Sporosarcina]MBY0223478.1 bifunctional 4-hydroxy-2-oxoglutarate aldolase/2-dehydro-3-deoxy-phosphogluconate aldolase [Sporosarcina aquimarina]SKA95737.1 2-dehydro-3-deoxyphosphogluconate aldolase / (4S)-4-hydroxy-2-oxoglutarate aldolase [Sporosarcina newyorkensis]